jgi:hypothetical protein
VGEGFGLEGVVVVSGGGGLGGFVGLGDGSWSWGWEDILWVWWVVWLIGDFVRRIVSLCFQFFSFRRD